MKCESVCECFFSVHNLHFHSATTVLMQLQKGDTVNVEPIHLMHAHTSTVLCEVQVRSELTMNADSA